MYIIIVSFPVRIFHVFYFTFDGEKYFMICPTEHDIHEMLYVHLRSPRSLRITSGI